MKTTEVEAFPMNTPAKTPKIKEGLINGAYAKRGMALKINEMLAMGCFTVEDIVKCLTPMTKNNTAEQAISKLKAHIKNLEKNNCLVWPIENRILASCDVCLPGE